MDTKQTEASTELPAEDAGLVVPPCPFCGKSVDLEDDDTLYPTGTYWRDEPNIGCRTYHGRRQWNEGDGVCFGMHCPMPAGGCGAQIIGDSKEEALAAWSQRAPADLERLPERVKELNQTLWSRERDLDARDCRIAQLEAELAALEQGAGGVGFEDHWAKVLRGNPAIPAFARALAEAAWNAAALKRGQGEPVAWEACCPGPIYAREVFTTKAEAEACSDAWDTCIIQPLSYTSAPTLPMRQK